MIIYGSRMYGKSDVVKGHGICGSCSRYAPQQSYNGRKFGHIYWIPLIPMGSRIRVLQECSACNCGQHVSVADLDGMRKGVRETLDLAMAALLSGQDTFDLDGEPCGAAATIWGGVDVMCSLGGATYIEKALGTLVDKNLPYETPMIGAAYLRFQGRTNEAIRAYEEALIARPDDEAALANLAEFTFHTNQMSEAKRYYIRLTETADNPTPYVLALLDVYTNLKDFPNLIDTYERSFERLPQLKEDKKFVKGYKKICKKAKTQPKL